MVLGHVNYGGLLPPLLAGGKSAVIRAGCPLTSSPIRAGQRRLGWRACRFRGSTGPSHETSHLHPTRRKLHGRHQGSSSQRNSSHDRTSRASTTEFALRIDALSSPITNIHFTSATASMMPGWPGTHHATGTMPSSYAYPPSKCP